MFARYAETGARICRIEARFIETIRTYIHDIKVLSSTESRAVTECVANALTPPNSIPTGAIDSMTEAFASSDLTIIIINERGLQRRTERTHQII
jgi:hypothetical protein